MGDKDFVLITAARNEQNYIEKTIESVIHQTILPRLWVVVSDASTDRTDEIVRKYASEYDFIRLKRLEGSNQRNFTSKVKAFRYGYEQLKDMQYEFVGNLDADISFDSGYYEKVLEEFQHNKRLGIAGGVRYDLCDREFRRVLCARNSVGGPFQLFRRQCYERIGGFVPLEGGGEDSVAEIMARMHGWHVESFPALRVYHYRATGTATGNILTARFRDGSKYYRIGYHPLFMVVRSVYRSKEKPYVFGGLLLLCGYFLALLRKYERPVPDDFLEYFTEEQMIRLRSLLSEAKEALCSLLVQRRGPAKPQT